MLLLLAEICTEAVVAALTAAWQQVAAAFQQAIYGEVIKRILLVRVICASLYAGFALLYMLLLVQEMQLVLLLYEAVVIGHVTLLVARSLPGSLSALT